MAAHSSDSGIEVRTYFVRERNALVARAELSELFATLNLHQLDCGISLEPACARLLRDGIAAITLHSASRPRKETTAWTVNFQSPLANIFVSGDNPSGSVVGNAFTENIRQARAGLFYADMVSSERGSRRSVIEFSGSDFLGAVETFYLQSEQRLARFFWYEEEDLVLVSAQPDCDSAWLEELDTTAIRQLDRDVQLSLLEQRRYRFECGCNHARMLAMLAPIMRKQPEELFAGEEAIRIHCPRCGARHVITREALEARVASHPET